MFAAVRHYWAPKTPGYELEYEDASSWDEAQGVAAVADGVSSAIFSRAWSEILTTALVADPLKDPATDGALTAWLHPHRQAWSERIDLPRLKWNQVAKLKQIGGGWATLLWLQMESAATSVIREGAAEDSDEANSEWRLTCHVIGDCNLFVVRDGQLRLSHPMQSSAAYAEKPHAVCSMNRGQDSQLTILTQSFDGSEGDTLALCTDAVGQWVWSELEQADGQFDWDRLWNWTTEDWHAEIARQRADLKMPIDDCTLLLVRLGANSSTSPATPVNWPPAEPVETVDQPSEPVEYPDTGATEAAAESPAETGAISETATAAEPDPSAAGDVVHEPADRNDSPGEFVVGEVAEHAEDSVETASATDRVEET